MVAWVWVMALGLSSAASDAGLVDRLAETLRNRIEMHPVMPALEVEGERLHSSVVLPRFYERRMYRPAWIGPGGPLRRADELVRAIEAVDREGLRPEDYHLSSIQALLLESRTTESQGRPFDLRRLGDLDLALTDAFLVLGAHLVSGRVHPETIDSLWRADLREVNLGEWLERALATDGIAASLEGLLPEHPGYRRLREALALYRELERRGGWTNVPEGPKLEKGASDDRVTLLRNRLAATGELGEAGTGNDFDDAVEQAVREFQRRHGLEPDGVVGPRTLAALNVSASDRVRQIELNLERWRWLPQELGSRYILVNIPQFELDVVEGRETVLAMRAVVGRPYRRTPVFSATMTYLVLSPYWHVPPTITSQDVLPAVRKDPSYLAQQNMKVFQGWGSDAREIDPKEVDWSAITARNLPFRFRQEPGPHNALGRVKFMFPNPYNVYLHDTPARELFGRAQRAFSSGCIRLEKPLELAEYLLADPRWNEKTILAAIEKRTEQTVRLPEPIAVHLLYWTSWAGFDGAVSFREDIYERDSRLEEALFEPPPPPESPRETVTAGEGARY